MFHSGGFHIIDGDEGRFAAHGQAHILGDQILVDLTAQGQDRGPLVVIVGLGDARVFVNALHRVVMMKLHLALARSRRSAVRR